MDIEIQNITGQPSDNKINITSAECLSVQMPYERLEAFLQLLKVRAGMCLQVRRYIISV